MKGSEIVIEALKREKVDVIFGYPGGAIMDVFDVLYRSPIRVLLTRHEQGAAHAADGYARASGKVGVCMATSGPGATNLVTGIATAYMDSIPIVAITGQVPTAMIGNDAFQEADVTGITRPITKHNYLVKNVDDLPRIIKEAFYIASSGRPGPVVIDLPKDIQQAQTDEKCPDRVDIRGYKPTYKGHMKQIKKVADAIARAERPVIYAGGGVILSGASEELRALAEKAQIPVTTTLLGIGAFPEDSRLSLKMLGMHGTRYANYAMVETDLILAIGARFDDRVTGKLSEFAPNARIVHIDIDPTAISKNVAVDIPVVGDVKAVLKELNKIVGAKEHPEWLEKIDGWKKEYPLVYGNGGELLNPQFVVEKICEVTGGDAIIATEVGQNQMWAAQFYTYRKPRHFLSSGGLGTMGYGFPAALGAQVARPDAIVFDIAGDGSIQMNIQELATAVINELPVNIAILNNQFLGMVRQWQELFYDRQYASTCLARRKECPQICNEPKPGCPGYSPDFVKLAEAYGALGMRVSREEDVVPALKEAIASPKPALIDFIVSREENVFPMVPAGASLDQMMGGMA